MTNVFGVLLLVGTPILMQPGIARFTITTYMLLGILSPIVLQTGISQIPLFSFQYNPRQELIIKML